jgi:hypothetical protein
LDDRTMKVLAFLQNMWVRDPDKARRMIERDATGKLRERLISYALFAGCLSGRRLKVALGEDWCDRITWEEASPVITRTPSECPPADPGHIVAAINKHEPDLILCLSRAAYRVIRANTVIPILEGPHPAARGAGVGEALQRVRVLLDLELKKFEGTWPPSAK